MPEKCALKDNIFRLIGDFLAVIEICKRKGPNQGFIIILELRQSDWNQTTTTLNHQERATYLYSSINHCWFSVAIGVQTCLTGPWPCTRATFFNFLIYLSVHVYSWHINHTMLGICIVWLIIYIVSNSSPAVCGAELWPSWVSHH
jgi:hypothetical protein